jgi:tetratricopeptide (TPR) repeat protein
MPQLADAPPARPPGRAGRRYLATFAVLAIAGVVAFRFYGKLPFPWNMRASAAAPTQPPGLPEPSPAPGGGPPPAAGPTPAEQAAERVRVATAKVEAILGAGASVEQLPALKEHFAALRKDGAAAEAAKLAERAQAALVRVAEAELDLDEIEAGVAHYQAALALGGDAKGREALAEALRKHAMAALTERKDPALAVRWAREGVATNNNETTHGLLADMLYAAHEYKDAVDEYQIALAGKPDDDALKRGLERARKKLGTEKATAKATARKPGKARAARTVAADGKGEGQAEKDAPPEKEAPPSAAGEAPPDEQ